MIIRSKDFFYEVVQMLSEQEGEAHYLCRREGEETLWHLVQISQRRLGRAGLSRILELEENPGFTDLNEYFLLDETIIMVFPFPQGRPISGLSEEPDWSMKERFEAGKCILERFLILMMPVWLRWEVSVPDRICLTDDMKAGFYYGLDQVESYDDIGEADVWKRLSALFRQLFQKEEWEGLYPEVEQFLAEADEGPWPELMDGYRAYLQLLPACSEERKREKEKTPFLIRIKKAGMKLLTAGKILMGMLVIAAALLLLPRAWEEQVKPYLDAAALWKAVYVDGEPLEPEPESEPEPEPETVPDQGFVTRYREDGQICYQGNMEHGIYEGKGTLYYPGGTMQYQGEFEFGQKEGQGCLYTEEGIMLYEGGFHKNRYEGEGKLYDEKFGVLIYDGGFSAGKYDGEGILFNPMTDYPVYKGSFRLGYYDGAGTEYDSNGNLLYEGKFLLGVYHGSGVYYDGMTGDVMLEGEFRNGMLVVSPQETEYPSEELESLEGEVGHEGVEDSMVDVEKG